MQRYAAPPERYVSNAGRAGAMAASLGVACSVAAAGECENDQRHRVRLAARYSHIDSVFEYLSAASGERHLPAFTVMARR